MSAATPVAAAPVRRGRVARLPERRGSGSVGGAAGYPGARVARTVGVARAAQSDPPEPFGSCRSCAGRARVQTARGVRFRVRFQDPGPVIGTAGVVRVVRPGYRVRDRDRGCPGRPGSGPGTRRRRVDRVGGTTGSGPGPGSAASRGPGPGPGPGSGLSGIVRTRPRSRAIRMTRPQARALGPGSGLSGLSGPGPRIVRVGSRTGVRIIRVGPGPGSGGLGGSTGPGSGLSGSGSRSRTRPRVVRTGTGDPARGYPGPQAPARDRDRIRLRLRLHRRACPARWSRRSWGRRRLALIM